MSEAILSVMEDIFRDPPISYEPANQSLKAWAMYCLRNRGFIVIYAQNADFALELRGGDKLYFKVTDRPEVPDETCNWIVWDGATQQAIVRRSPVS